MTIDQHPALDAPGEVHLGPELDCPKCRRALENPGPVVPELPPETPPWNGEHVTWSRVDPFKDGPGGTWACGCSCGWSKSGGYARDGMGEHAAGRLARMFADKHRANPLADDPEARPHLMLPPEHTRTVDINPVHTARYVALEDPGSLTTGMWEAACSCGWQTGGRYGGPTDEVRDFTHARIRAQAAAEAHLTEEHK